MKTGQNRINTPDRCPKYSSNFAGLNLDNFFIFNWSGRGDLNARPPAPKADAKELHKQLVFNYLRNKDLVVAC